MGAPRRPRPAVAGAGGVPMTLSRRRVCLCLAGGGVAALAARPALAAMTDRAVVIGMVDAAVKAIEHLGLRRALHETAPQVWFQARRGLYVFILDRQGKLYLHPDAGMEGMNVAAMRDANGKPFIRDIIAASLAAPRRGAWTSYVWTDPRTGAAATKHTYSRLADRFIVAAGYFAKST